MNLDSIYCADLESDGLLDTITKIHVFAWGKHLTINSTKDYSEITKLLTNPENTFAIHNGIRFDKVAVEKILGIKVKATIIDTLALAWYLDLGREKYGLESYGEEFGVAKPAISDWQNLSYQQYKYRVEEDVKITIRLWEKLLGKLRSIYESEEDIVRVIKYLGFIMECSYHQERQMIQVDVDKINSNLAYFQQLKSVKVEQLKLSMPKVPIKKVVKKPKNLLKKNGEISVRGNKWLSLNPNGGDEIEIIVGYQEPNPNSVSQKKAWLYSLGWVPQTFSYVRDKGSRKVKKIPQILAEEKELCPSVVKLKKKEPAIELLEGISILSHRIGLFKGLLNAQKDGFVTQGLNQLAVSLRWQHSVIVNFPRVTGKGDIRDGKWIRECIIAGKSNKIVQADLSGIESRTSDHYTFHLNPNLIKETQQKYFDPHTKIAVVSNLMTPEEEVWFKWTRENKERKDKGLPPLPIEEFGSLSQGFKGDMDRLKAARSKAKTTNYACLYLVSEATLARNLSISKKEAKTLIDAYWKIHWAVLAITKTFRIKRIGEEMWIHNPISKFWHNLRHEKDAFSVVNQSSAVYCFNMWVYNLTRLGIWPICQNHDDLLVRCKEQDAEQVKGLIYTAMVFLNKQLKLNVSLACEVQIGDSYDQTH